MRWIKHGKSRKVKLYCHQAKEGEWFYSIADINSYKCIYQFNSISPKLSNEMVPAIITSMSAVVPKFMDIS